MSITNSTALIHVATLAYPKYLHQIRRENQLVSLPKTPTVEQLSDLGYEVVHPGTRPEGDVVTAAAPEFIDNQWVEQFDVRDFTEEEILSELNKQKSLHMSEIKSYQTRLLENGIEFDFGGTFGVLHVQVRDGDRANLITMHVEARHAVDTEDTSKVWFFIVRENDIVTGLSAEEVILMTLAAAEGYSDIVRDIRIMKNQTEEATTISELPVIPVV